MGPLISHAWFRSAALIKFFSFKFAEDFDALRSASSIGSLLIIDRWQKSNGSQEEIRQ
jgi:hypothetical protein